MAMLFGKIILLFLIFSLVTITLATLGGVNLDIEQVLYPRQTDEIGGLLIGRIAPLAAVCFLLQTTALLLLYYFEANRRVRSLAASLAMISTAGSSVAMLGYFYKTAVELGEVKIPMSLPISLVLTLLGIAVMTSAGPHCWPFDRLTGSSVRATILRALLPVSTMIPIYGWLNAVVLRDSVNPALSAAFLTILFVGILSTVANRVAETIGGKIDSAQTARRQSEEKFRVIFDSSPNALITVDSFQGSISLVNSQVENVFGYKPEELLGMQMEVLVPERFQKIHQQDRRNYMKAPSARPMGAGRHLVGRHKNGKEIPLEIALTPIRDQSRAVILVTVTDISTRTRLERERDEALKAREELIGVVSHEIRNPLSVIATGFEIIRRVLPPTYESREKVEKQFDHINAAVQTMTRITADLLDVTRIEAGLLRIEPRSTNIVLLIEDILMQFKARAEAKKIRLESHLSPEAKSINCDRDRIVQVLANLLGNAIKFTTEGGLIVLEVQSGKESIHFQVKDNGIGIPPEEAEHVFERFWQAKHKQYVGSGLGLYIARNIIRAHGGEIGVRSKPGEGSTFYFDLPLATREKTAA